MVEILSSSQIFYKNPQNVKVADMVYDNVCNQVVNEFIDNDGIRKTMNCLWTDNSYISSYVIDNKVVRSMEYFNSAQTMQLGDKVYSGIVSKTIIPGKYSTYAAITPYNHENLIRVRKNGSVADIDKLKNELILRKLKQPFLRIARALR